MANLGFPNIFAQSANWLNQAGQAAGQAAGYDPRMVHAATPSAMQMANPANMAASTIRGMGLGAYQNPYEQQVINRTMNDMDRARQMALNTTGAQATSAGAFGGDRQALVEAETNRGFAQEAGNMAAGLRSQGFNTALGAAQFDAGQQNAMKQFNSGQGFQAGLANMGAQNNMAQFNAGNKMQAGLANQQAGLAGAGMNLQGAGQLGNLSNLGFGMGQAVNGMQAQYGAQQQGLMQSLIDAAKGQWGGFTNQPYQGLQSLVGAMGSIGGTNSTTSGSSNPGLFGIASGLLGFL